MFLPWKPPFGTGILITGGYLKELDSNLRPHMFAVDRLLLSQITNWYLHLLKTIPKILLESKCWHTNFAAIMRAILFCQVATSKTLVDPDSGVKNPDPTASQGRHSFFEIFTWWALLRISGQVQRSGNSPDDAASWPDCWTGGFRVEVPTVGDLNDPIALNTTWVVFKASVGWWW